MPTPGSCTDCMDEGPVAKRVPESSWTRRAFAAQFPGTCAVCDERYPEGAMIRRRTMEGRTRYSHEDCRP